MRKLLTPPNAQPKTAKSTKLNVLTYALHLAPADLSGFEVCPMRSAGCTAACLNTAGRGIFAPVQAARVARTKFYFADRDAFMAQLVKEITGAAIVARRKRMKLAIRLNATSDIPWERVPVVVEGYNYGSLMHAFPRVQFYDYTKITKRAIACATKDPAWPRNYHLTFSASEDNGGAVYKVLQSGGNVAMVFRNKAVVAHKVANVYRVVDGDETDARFLDPQAEPGTRGYIVALYAKGKAKRDTSGFVRD